MSLSTLLLRLALGLVTLALLEGNAYAGNRIPKNPTMKIPGLLTGCGKKLVDGAGLGGGRHQAMLGKLQAMVDASGAEMSPRQLAQVQRMNAFTQRLYGSTSPENEWSEGSPLGDHYLTADLPVVPYRHEDRDSIRNALGLDKIRRQAAKIALGGKVDMAAMQQLGDTRLLLRRLFEAEFRCYQQAKQRLAANRNRLAGKEGRQQALGELPEIVARGETYVTQLRRSLLAKVVDLHRAIVFPVTDVLDLSLFMTLAKDQLEAEGTPYEAKKIAVAKRFADLSDPTLLEVGSYETDALVIGPNASRRAGVGRVAHQMEKWFLKVRSEDRHAQMLLCPQVIADAPDTISADFQGNIYVGPEVFLIAAIGKGVDLRLEGQRGLYRQIVRERSGAPNAFRGKIFGMLSANDEGTVARLEEESLQGVLFSPWLLRSLRKNFETLKSKRARKAIVTMLTALLESDREILARHQGHMAQLDKTIDGQLDAFREAGRRFDGWRIEAHSTTTANHFQAALVHRRAAQDSLLPLEFPIFILGTHKTHDFRYLRVLVVPDEGPTFEFPCYGKDEAPLFDVLAPVLNGGVEASFVFSPAQVEAFWKLLLTIRRQSDVFVGITQYLDAEYAKLLQELQELGKNPTSDAAAARVFALLDAFELPSQTRLTRRVRRDLPIPTAVVAEDGVKVALFSPDNVGKLAALPTMNTRSAPYRKALEHIGSEALTVMAEDAGFLVIPRHDDHEGADFLLRHRTTGEEWYVELKSTASLDGEINMSAQEIDFAYDHPKNWLLAVAHVDPVQGVRIFLRQQPKLGDRLRPGRQRSLLVEEDVLATLPFAFPSRE